MSSGNSNGFAGISTGNPNEKVFKYRDENMCGKWNTAEKNLGNLNVKIYGGQDGNIVVTGNMAAVLAASTKGMPVYAQYRAANKATCGQSFSGSGLPYANKAMAFQGTTNAGFVPVKAGSFSFSIQYPNSYYVNMGTKLVPPQVKIIFCDQNKVPISDIYVVQLGNGIPYRSLTWPQKRNWLNGPMFYCNNNLPVRDQQTILKNSGYPCTNKEAPNFWGLVPPH